MLSGIKVLIVEDEPLYSKVLEMELEDVGCEIVAVVTNYEDAILAIEQNQIDIALLDIIIIGDKDGIDIGDYLKEKTSLPFIFTSSMTDQSIIDRAKVTNPSGYLVKPFDTNDLLITMQVALYNEGTTDSDLPISGHFFKEDRIFVKDKFRFERVFLNDIQFLEADGNYVKLNTATKGYLLASTLSNLFDKIDLADLIRTHRSFAVNIEKVDAVEGNKLFIGEREIPVGRNHREEVGKYFNFL